MVRSRKNCGEVVTVGRRAARRAAAKSRSPNKVLVATASHVFLEHHEDNLDTQHVKQQLGRVTFEEEYLHTPSRHHHPCGRPALGALGCVCVL
eukprot:3346964-Prymnesium_polylepis.1